MNPPGMYPGVVCTCGAVIIAPAPDVHTFLAHHAPGAQAQAHTLNMALPGEPLSYRIQPAYARLLARALTTFLDDV